MREFMWEEIPFHAVRAHLRGRPYGKKQAFFGHLKLACLPCDDPLTNDDNLIARSQGQTLLGPFSTFAIIQCSRQFLGKAFEIPTVSAIKRGGQLLTLSTTTNRTGLLLIATSCQTL